MSKTLVRILAAFLSLLMILPLAMSCGTLGTDENEEGTTTTTKEDTSEVTPPSDLDAAIAENPYASAGLELMHNVIDDYYTKRTDWLKSSTTDSGACAVWAVGSFIEALAEAYRLNPEDKEIKEIYIDSLDGLLQEYKVENVTIRTPNRGTFAGITYYNATRGMSGDYYYDDNAWLCIQLLEAYSLLEDEKYLALAEENLEFLWTGWDEEVLGGGIYWDKSYGGKNTCANGPVAIAFLMAYQYTEKEEYLTKAKQIYDWANEKLLDGSLYIDSIGKDGGKNGWKAAYNQATMLYAASQLFEITGEEDYYKHAKKVYNATIGLMFKVEGGRKDMKVSMNGNPIYKAWCIGWLTRSYVKYYTIDETKNESALNYLELVLDKELTTKSKAGYYDPYFLTGDWGSESTTDVLQPTGLVSVFCLAGYYDIYLKK